MEQQLYCDPTRIVVKPGAMEMVIGTIAFIFDVVLGIIRGLIHELLGT